MIYTQKWEELYENTTYITPIVKWEKCSDNIETVIHILKDVRFITNSIKRKIINFSKYYTTVGNITIYNRENNFYLLDKLIFIYYFIENIAKQSNKNIKVYLIPLNIPKKITKPLLSTKNINSGVCINHNTIVIWRLEEITKVLVHELIHAHKLDYSTYNLNHFLKGFKLTNDSFKAPNESITDTMAIVIISFLNSKWYKVSPEKIFNSEVIWTLKQMVKIWENIDDCNNIYQETDVMSYYFLKGIFLHSIYLDNTIVNLFFTKTILANNACTSEPLQQIYDLIIKKATFTNLKKSLSLITTDKTSSLIMSCWSMYSPIKL